MPMIVFLFLLYIQYRAADPFLTAKFPDGTTLEFPRPLRALFPPRRGSPTTCILVG